MIESSLSVNEEAAAWVVRLNSDQRTRDDLNAFDAWLARGEDHRRAYADNATLWVGVGLLADNEEARDILLRPIARAGEGRTPSRRRAILGGLALASAAALAVVIASPTLGTRTYKTLQGEQRRIALADGSIVLLNTDSVLRVNLRAAERRLSLDRGQAFFRVAHDSRRPFRVFVGTDEVRAIGTAFDVRWVEGQARVTLEEGRVAIYKAVSARPRGAVDRAVAMIPGRQPPPVKPAAVLAPGQQTVLATTEAPLIKPVDIRHTQAWRVGRLVLDDDTLASAADELNRYGAPRIVLADKRIASLRVSGVFHTGDAGAFVDAVTSAFPVRVVRRDADEIVLASR